MTTPFRVVIPARFGATRLPGKPLLPIAGRPMLAHVHARALESGAEEVVIATDDERIRVAAEGFGATVVMTSANHRSGTDRLAEVAAGRGWAPQTIVVNLQGDEPLMPPRLIGQVAELLACAPDAAMGTLCTPIESAEELADPNAVKVVVDSAGYALYFSRAPIPWDREQFTTTTPPTAGLHFRHLGLYAYRAGFLARYAQLTPASLEQLESLEQLRVLWHGERIRIAQALELPGAGVDTAADLERVRAWLEGHAGLPH